MKNLTCDGCGKPIITAKLSFNVPLQDWEPGGKIWEYKYMDFCEPCTNEIFTNMRAVVARLKEQRT